MKTKAIQTRADVQNVLLEFLAPLEHKFKADCTGFDLGINTAHYSTQVSQMEGMLRTLFGLVPYFAGGGTLSWWGQYLKGLTNGTDKTSAAYWGDASPYDQRVVEMSTIGLGLLLAPEKIWEPLSDIEKQNLGNWLLSINNEFETNNNWAFFILLVNEGLRHVGFSYSAEKIAAMSAAIEACYIGDGWYSDGYKNGAHTQQRDYYVPFAMHFYGLLYGKIMEDEKPELLPKFVARAKLFTPDFMRWFAKSGAALPFGRSQTYRFAQGAFWGALAFAGAEVLPWGVIKGLYLRHLEWWLTQPICNNEGILTMGYAYPNLKSAEFYNSPGSPYWCFKFFLPLALPETHPFWQAEALPLPDMEAVYAEQHPHMIFCREQDRDHVFALTGGQYAPFQPTNIAAKYEKFAYSTAFGFSVPSSEYSLDQGAYDSMLALCEHDGLYRVRRKCEVIEVSQSMHYTLWKPWEDVVIETWLIPCVPWHIRIHKIVSARVLDGAEGGFALNRENVATGKFYLRTEQISSTCAFVQNAHGFSGIVNMRGNRTPLLVDTAPNTNLLYPRAVSTPLQRDSQKGTTRAYSAVLGQPFAETAPYDCENIPVITPMPHGIIITYHDKQTPITLPHFDASPARRN